MKEFMLIFRASDNGNAEFSPAQRQEITTTWLNWIGGIAAQNKLVDKGSRLGVGDSKIVKPGKVVTDGPYTEIKEFINGYVIVKTITVDDAAELAKNCPVLLFGGNVEVRPIVVPDDNS